MAKIIVLKLDLAIQQFIAYLNIEKKYAQHTTTSYLNDLKQFAIFLSEEYEIVEVSAIAHVGIRSWIVQLMSDKNMATTVNRKISALRSFYNYLLKKKIVEKNPMLKVVAPKKPKKLPVVVQDANISRLIEPDILLEGQDSFESSRDRFIIELFYATGIRRAELRALLISDIDIKRKEIRVLGKGNKVRSIPITDSLIASFHIYIDERKLVVNQDKNNLLFICKNGNPIYDKLIYNIVRKKLGTISSLTKRSPHILRHTFATHMLDEGADLNAIKELLGHASLAATQVYTHNSISKLKEVYQKSHPRSGE